MPCKRKRQSPTKCTPTSRRMLEGLTIKDLSEAAPDYLPSSQTPHPIPTSGQYANDLDDCNPGVSCTKCSYQQESNETLPLTPNPQTPSQSESCVSTCREVSAMYDDIRQCRNTIGALAKEAQQLIITASGILDGCGCDKSFQAKQGKKVEYNEFKRTSSKNSYEQKICKEKCNEKLIPCASCESATKKRRNAPQNGNVVMSKRYDTNMYAKRSSYKDTHQKQQVYNGRRKAQVISYDPKIRQRNKADPEKEKPDVKNCCQKVCGDKCACDADETETKQQSKLNGGTAEGNVDVDNCGCKKETSCKEKLSKTICSKTNSCVCVAPNEDNKDMKQENNTADTKNGRHENNGKKASGKDTCCDCAARKGVENSPSKEVTKKRNIGFKIPNQKNGRQMKNGKRASDQKKSVCPDSQKCCDKVCGEKIKEKDEVKRPNTTAQDCTYSNIDLDDCSCFREMKKRKKKLGRFARIWRILRERDVRCDCSKKTYSCGCVEDMDSQTSCPKRASSKICCLKKIKNKMCGKKVTCKCSSKKVDDCRCDENLEYQKGFFKKVGSCCSLDKIRNKVCGRNTTCECPSKNVDDCQCDDDVENQNVFFKTTISDKCSFTKIRNKVCGKNVHCECTSKADVCGCDEYIENQMSCFKNGKKVNCKCTSKADVCGCDEYMENQKSCFKNVIVDTCSLTKIRKKVCGKVICECPQEKIETSQTTSDKNTYNVSDAPTDVANFIFNGAKNKRGQKYKSDSEVELSNITPSAEKTCKCCFPPAYSQYFECTGQIGGNCQCGKRD